MARFIDRFVGGFAAVLLSTGAVDFRAPPLAQDIGNSITRTTKELSGRSEAVRQAPSSKIILFSAPLSTAEDEALLPSTPPPPLQTFTAGFEINDGRGGEERSLPFSYSFVTSTRRWNFRLESDYGWAKANGVEDRGLGGLTALATYVFKQKRHNEFAYQLLGTLGVGVPSHGERGGSAYSQQARIIGVLGMRRLTTVLAASLIHLNERPAGVGGVLRIGHSEVHYELNSKDTVIAKISRAHLIHGSGSTTATLEYDRQLTAFWGVEVLATRRLSGPLATIGQINLVYSF